MSDPIIVAPMDAKLRRALSIVGSSPGRPADDFYPTPPEATEALLRVETFEGQIWEPACGDGAMSRVLENHGHDVYSTDLIDRGYGVAPVDFLTSTHRCANIVTNPPFTLAQPFVEHALSLTTGKVAMLCKLQFLEGAKRRKMFESTPLARVWVFSKRISLTRNGVKMKHGGMVPYCWLTFIHGHVGPPALGWI